MAKGDGAAVVKSSRSERAAWDPADFVKQTNQPQLGRDIPYRTVNGQVVRDLQVRIEAYGSMGLRRETYCDHCGKWLSYEMCRPCQSLLRLTGNDDRSCDCFANSIYIYGRCEDHRMFEQGPFGPVTGR